MLRKAIHIAFSFLLLASTLGISLSMHYCGGKYVSTSINKEAKSCCDDDGGCCENTTLHFEVKDDYVNAVQIENSEIVELDVLFPILFVLNFELLPLEEKAEVVFYHSSPPPKIQTRLSLLQTYLC